MPNATISTDYGEAINLKSLEGAWVRLRPLPYGMKLQRRDKATMLSMQRQQETGEKLSIEFLNRWSREFDFSNCIGEHNLEDANGKPLNFQNPATLEVLHPAVGTELEELIDVLNGETEEVELLDFQKPAESSSSDVIQLRPEDTPETP